MAMYLKPMTKNIQCDKVDSVFVLISCDHNLVSDVTLGLSLLPTVSEVKRVDGLYDLFVKLKPSDVEKTKQVIANKIRSMNGVRTCLTLIGNNGFLG